MDVLKLEYNSAAYLHILIEALRLSFADSEYGILDIAYHSAQYYVTDPEFEQIPVQELLSKEYLRSRAEVIDLNKAGTPEHGNPVRCTDTVYLTTSDQWGNACSLIASNYAGG